MDPYRMDPYRMDPYRMDLYSIEPYSTPRGAGLMGLVQAFIFVGLTAALAIVLTGAYWSMIG